MFFEEQLLKKLFNLDGELFLGGVSDFDFNIKNSPDFEYANIRLRGNKAELRCSPHPKIEAVLEGVAELSFEEIARLKKDGYKF